MAKVNPRLMIIGLVIASITGLFAGAGIGAVNISPLQILGMIGGSLGIDHNIVITEQQEAIFSAIRFPRVLMAMLVGAALAIAGAVMQGIFRNPLADPSLIGISSGASLFAVMGIVLELHLFSGLLAGFGSFALPLISFCGAFIATLVVYKISQVNGKTVIATMLLAGIAINALAMSMTGVFTYTADDVQLRSITFWMLGSLGGASWKSLTVVLLFIVTPVMVLPFFGKTLNAFALGESNAQHLGFKIERSKRWIVILSAVAVGASVAVAGVIGFVGLVVPHIMRMISGPDNRYLLVTSALFGAVLLVAADLIARTAFAPAEIPIGIVTSIVGAPVFLYIILQERRNLRFA